MKVQLKGGPYDGTPLDHNDINTRTQFVPGRRKFLIMPPVDDWDAVCRGEIPKDGPFTSNNSSIYEIVGDVALYDSDGSRFKSASNSDGEIGSNEAAVPFTGSYFQCFLTDAPSVDDADHFVIIDEKGRKWFCLPISRAEGESGGRRVKTAWTNLTINWCHNADELRTKLSDVI